MSDFDASVADLVPFVWDFVNQEFVSTEWKYVTVGHVFV